MSIPRSEIRSVVHRIVNETPVVDMHTHLYPPSFDGLLLWGIDELLTYHYLIAEVLRATRLPYNEFWKMPKDKQADLIWQKLFIERAPISEACRGVVTCLQALGIDPATRDLNEIRRFFQPLTADEYVDKVLDIAKVKYAVMTNDPFDKTERKCWNEGRALHPRLHTALRMDPLLSHWDSAMVLLEEQNYEVYDSLNDMTLREVRRFLETWADKMKPRYMAVSLTPDFQYPDDTHRTKLLDSCILPFALERKLPFALMIGVRRQINPSLKLAGDGVGKADVTTIEQLCSNHPDNRFLVTLLSRENQHELAVLARKFPNLLPFGCWWFLNNPVLIEEITRMRMELLGWSFVPQHSDARVLDQVMYKWNHSRRIIAKVLADKYEDIADGGWTVTEDEIKRDVKLYFESNFEDFVAYR